MSETANRDRILGGYDAYSNVLSYLNTLPDRAVEKKTIYAAVMEMRPPAGSPIAALTTPRYITDWSEEDGDVLWWKFPVNEPPYVGSPLDTDFDENWHTWWTPLPGPDLVAAAFEAMRLSRQRALISIVQGEGE